MSARAPVASDAGDALGSVAPGDSVASLAEAWEPEREADARAVESAPGEPGRYRVGAEIGAGGMGRVSLVRDRRLLRDVAWKRGDWRLLREARILAQLEHPGIVPIHDMGESPDGEAYFAMRVVRGRSLAEVLQTTRAAERLTLLRPLLRAAEAVAYAHHRGVVHRDLKPANVMIGAFGESQVVDWGLARMLDDAADPLPLEVRRALAGGDLGRIGTPGYMSPEQAAGRAADRRSDVYGLGRMLARVVAPAPGAAADPVAPELEAIAAKATAADPVERYPDAAAFAADLERYLDGGRVSAHTYRQRELLSRFVRAQRVPLAIGALGLVVLIAVGIAYVIRVGAERERAEDAAQQTRTALARSDRYLSRSLVGEARRLAEAGARPEAEVLAAHAIALHDDPDARGILAALGGGPELELIARAPLACPDADVDAAADVALCAAPEGLTLWADASRAPRLAWRLSSPVRAARLVAGGIVAASADGQIVMLDRDGRELARARAPSNPTRKDDVRGSRVVFESATVSTLVDLAARRVSPLAACGDALHAAFVLAPDGAGADLAGALCRDGTLLLGDARVPTPLVAPEREAVRMALVGDRVVVGTTKGEVFVLDPSGAVVTSGRVVAGMVRVLEPSPDGDLLAVAGEGDPIALVTLPDLAHVASLPRRAKAVSWVAGHARELVSTGAWLERWRLDAPAATRPLDGAHTISPYDGAVSLDADPTAPDRLALAFGPYVGTLDPTHLAARVPTGFITAKGAAFVGDALLAAGVGGLFALDPATLAPNATLSARAFRRLAPLADGTTLVATYGGLARLADGALTPLVDGAPLDVSAAPDRSCAVLLRESDRSLWRVRAGSPEAEELLADARAEAVAIGPGGDRLFTARPGEVAVWDDGGALVFVHDAEDAALIDVAVAPDARWIAAGAIDGSVFLWSAGEPAPRACFHDHRERVPALTFSPDGAWLASGSWDRTLRVRDLAAVERPAAALLGELARRYAVDLDDALDAPRDD